MVRGSEAGFSGRVRVDRGSRRLPYLSDKVVTGWWQGTLDAFGVGFIVAGVVDVLAIFGLNSVVAGEQKRRDYDRRARSILEEPLGQETAARELLELSGDGIDGSLRAGLIRLIQIGDHEYFSETSAFKVKASDLSPTRRQSTWTTGDADVSALTESAEADGGDVS